jgi:hypothetical protein
LADKLAAAEPDPSVIVVKITIDAINKRDPDGKHIRNYRVTIKYKKARTAYKTAKIAADVTPGDATLEFEHREDCPWLNPVS